MPRKMQCCVKDSELFRLQGRAGIGFQAGKVLDMLRSFTIDSSVSLAIARWSQQAANRRVKSYE